MSEKKIETVCLTETVDNKIFDQTSGFDGSLIF